MPELYKKKWKECLDLIRRSLNNDSRFETWFANTRAVGYKNNVLTLSLPSHYYYELYEEQFFPIISAALKQVFGKSVMVEYEIAIVGDRKEDSMTVRSAQPAGSETTANEMPRFAGGHDKKERETNRAQEDFQSYLNPSLTFENYCVSKINKLPFTIAETISKQPKNSTFNPFFLYGDVGVGKTHLMQAIGIRVKQTFPEKKVLFIAMKEFQRLYANAVIEKKIPMFINWFMQIDVLLFDDLQELSNKTRTLNDALFPIFNHLHQNGKQLVFTSDRPPMELEGMEDRLIDRFKWGITEKLEKPDAALRRKILTFKALKNGLSLPDDIIDYISKAPINSVREIEGIVLGMMTRAINMGIDIDMDLAREVMKNSIRSGKKKSINFDMLVETVADRFNLNPDVIFSKSRVREVADARMMIMYLAHSLMGLTAVAIGRKLNRKHSTVMHGISSMADKISDNGEMAEIAEEVKKELARN